MSLKDVKTAITQLTFWLKLLSRSEFLSGFQSLLQNFDDEI